MGTAASSARAPLTRASTVMATSASHDVTATAATMGDAVQRRPAEQRHEVGARRHPQRHGHGGQGEPGVQGHVDQRGRRVRLAEAPAGGQRPAPAPGHHDEAANTAYETATRPAVTGRGTAAATRPSTASRAAAARTPADHQAARPGRVAVVRPNDCATARAVSAGRTALATPATTSRAHPTR